MRVAVAMSGGIDSSVAAALLKEAGNEVLGVTMQIWPSDKEAFSGCCGLEAIENAKRIATKLGIPHYVFDLRDIFAQKVIANFCREYSLGRTPNPCVRCNQYIKFGILLEKVLELGADFLATGHYARIEHAPNGYHLLKAADQSKDQSYFLYTLGQSELSRLLLPIGKLPGAEVKRLAREFGLPVADKRGSQDVCFVPNGNYRAFVAKYVPLRSGEIVDISGKVLGRHEGLALYTVGQRHGLGLSSSQPLYVLRLDAENNRVVVGPREQLLKNGLIASELSWVLGKAPEGVIEVAAKIRYKAAEVACGLKLGDGKAEVRFLKPQSAITPGQSVVFYRGDEVLGGGIIDAVLG